LRLRAAIPQFGQAPADATIEDAVAWRETRRKRAGRNRGLASTGDAQNLTPLIGKAARAFPNAATTQAMKL
jgi:hypothetical protein